MNPATRPTAHLEPGMAVTPTIRLVSELGKGGMGSVWVADHLALRTQVVVKFMAMELALNAEAIERFSREAAAAAQVKSPHVVQMLDHGVTPGGVPFIAMEMLEGQDLAKLLAARGHLPLARVADIIGQVSKALSRAHERGIVHRDIKPDNIFLCEVGGGETFVKLLDFGIAKGGNTSIAGSNGTRTGAMVGTPYYMSPEQVVASKTIDLRTDLWSLGIVAYECVLGVRPIDAESFGALAIAIHSGPLPRPSAMDASLPPAFDAWFAKACAREPAARFANARELADALSAVASGAAWTPPLPPPSLGAAGTSARTTPMPDAGAPTLAASPFGSTTPGPTSSRVGAATGSQTRASGGAGTWIAVVLAVLVAGGAGVWLLSRRPPNPGIATTSAAPGVAGPPSASVVAPPSEGPGASSSPSSSASASPSSSPATVPTPSPANSAATSHGAAAHSTAPPRGASPPRPGASTPKPQNGEKDIF